MITTTMVQDSDQKHSQTLQRVPARMIDHFDVKKNLILLATDHFRTIILAGDFPPERALVVQELTFGMIFSKGNPQ